MNKRVLFVVTFFLLIVCLSLFVFAENPQDRTYENYLKPRALSDPISRSGFGDPYCDYYDQPECGVFRFFDEDGTTRYVSHSFDDLVSGVSTGTTLYFNGLDVSISNGSTLVPVNSVVYDPDLTLYIKFDYSIIGGMCYVFYPVITDQPINAAAFNYSNWIVSSQRSLNTEMLVAPVFTGNPYKEFVYSAYRGSNLLPYPFSSNTSVNASVVGDTLVYTEYGVTLEYNIKTGYFKIFGTNTGSKNFTFRFIYRDNDPLMLPYSWYANLPDLTHYSGSRPFFNFKFKNPDGSYTDVNGVTGSRYFEGGQYSHLSRFTLLVPPGTSINVDSSYQDTMYDISFNMGTYVLSFQPYIPGLLDQAYQDGYQAGDPDQAYQNGYDAGYDVGYDDGYDVGFETSEDAYQLGYENGSQSVLDALEPFKPDFFNYATVEYYYSFSAGLNMFNSVVVNRGNNAVSFSDQGFSFSASRLLYNHLVNPDRPEENPENTYIEESYIRIVFDLDHMPVYNEDTFFLSNTLGFTNVSFIDSAGRIYYGGITIDPSLGNRLIVSGVSVPVYISEINIYFDSLFNFMTDNVDYTIYSSSVSYDKGYIDGYADCLDNNGSDYADLAYKDGYKVGYDAGKADGIGISEIGTLNGLVLSVVQAPVDVFMSLLNFDLLGVNMLAFAGSILAICLVGFIIRKFLL